MKKKIKILGIAALTAIVVLFMVSCDEGGSKIPEELIAKWYITQAYANAENETYLMNEFKANGKLFLAGFEQGTFEVSGNTITTSLYGGMGGGTAKWAVSGTVLTITEAETGICIHKGTYYKKE
ncbi:MAG: hypothetical protein FWD47_07430 [Treponema sp.]|nr:hypothetical protein [Treponema sp.]